MYANDTSLAYSAKNVSDILIFMNYELKSFRKWFHSNILSLNVAKTTPLLLDKKNALQDKSNGGQFRTEFK